jgi:UPF0755 protein
VRILLILLLVAALASTAAIGLAVHALHRPLALDAPVVIEVPPGAALSRLASDLAGRELLEHPRLFALWGRITGDAARIHAGEYRLEPGLDALGLLEILVRGRVLRRSLTLVEGWRFRDVRTALAAAPRLEPTIDDLDDGEIMRRLGAPDRVPEGRFFPDTYEYVAGNTDLALLRRAFQRMQTVLAEEWAQRDFDLPLETPDEALVLASLIEKETAVGAERRRIAAVFIRRLERGMRLQTDPAVIYGLGEDFDGNLTRAHLRAPSPWNTYLQRGLPPTPIAMPGRASIHAALHPAEGDALYFVARGDGSSVFSATLEEHNRAVRRYQLQRDDDYRSTPAPAEDDGAGASDRKRP